MKKFKYPFFISLSVFLFTACSPENNTSTRQEKHNNSHDAMVDHVAYIDEFELDQSEYTVFRTIMEASVDGAAETIINQQMDKQAEELENTLENAKIHRVGNGIHVSFSTDEAFGVDSKFLSLKAKNMLTEFATIVNKYDNNDISVEAHTDALGEQAYNVSLSEERAENIKNHLIDNGVEATRIFTEGYGGAQPIAKNDTPGGQLLNRRIDIAIYPAVDADEAVLNGDIR